MIIGGAYPGGYTPLGAPSAPQITYRPKYGALRVSLSGAIGPAIARIIGQFGVDAALYIADRSLRALDGSTPNGVWIAVPGIQPVTLSAIKEEDSIRTYGADLKITIDGRMPMPIGVDVKPGMGLVVMAGMFANQSFLIKAVRPTEVARVVRLGLERMKTPIIPIPTVGDTSGEVLE